MILLTGATGFLGRGLVELLGRNNVVTLSQKDSDVNCNLMLDVPTLGLFDTIIHAAGKAHIVPKDVAESKLFFDVNVKGTQNLLTALERSGVPKSFIFISSVSVYGVTRGTLIDEQHPLLADDPYGLSKIEAEKLIARWCERHNVICCILRLPLIADQNPPGNLGAMIKGISRGYYFNVANGKARKSIVLAHDIARIIPSATQIGGIYNLTDGYNPSFSELSALIASQLGKVKPYEIPEWIAKLIAKAGDLFGSRAWINSAKLHKITTDLTFDDSKAREKLGWNPTSVLDALKV